jgi:transposase
VVAQIGQTALRARSGRRRVIQSAQEAGLRAQVARYPDATLAEHCTRWGKRYGVRVSPATMCRAIARVRLPLKKSLIAAERDPIHHVAWQQTLAGIDPRRLVFLGETATPSLAGVSVTCASCWW